MNSIVAGNAATIVTGDLSGTFESLGNNVVGSGGTLNLPSALPGVSDLKGAAASPLNLGPLADNGGPTLTMMPGVGSVAIDHSNTYQSVELFWELSAAPIGLSDILTLPLNDQRGTGFPRVIGRYVDSGAVEYSPTPCPTFPYTVPASDVIQLSIAVSCANANGAGTNDVINLTPGTYTITQAQVSVMDPTGSLPFTYVAAVPFIDSAVDGGTLTINGHGATIRRDSSAAQDFGIFYVAKNAVLQLEQVTLSGGTRGAVFNLGTFSLTNGSITNTSVIPYDTITSLQSVIGIGVIDNRNTVTVANSTLSNNTGPGIFLNGFGGFTPSTTVQNSTFSGNLAALGAGITNYDGKVIVDQTTFSDNTVSSGTNPLFGAPFAGGAITNLSGSIFISNSTFMDNLAEAGGAIYNAGSGTLTLANSTFDDNEADTEGGAIWNSGTMNIVNSTISDNSAATSGGGGIFNSSTLKLYNTIVANNHGGDCVSSGTVTANHSLIENTGVSACGIADGGAAANIIGQDPLLGTLGNYGGSTWTIPLLSGSPAIDMGNNSNLSEASLNLDLNGDGDKTDTLIYDQRGPGYLRINNTTVDIGAFELNPNSLNVRATLQGRDSQPYPHASRVITVRVTIMPSGGGAAFYNETFLTDGDGDFTLPSLPTGTYLFRFKGTHTLAVEQEITITAGTNSFITALLLEGDANDDNTVSLPDFSLLASSFGKSLGQAGYDARADFNGDNMISLVDFSLLATNYSKTGDGGAS